MFTHALIRDGAYASLLHSSRRELHRVAASWYENRDPTLRAERLDRAEDPRAAEAYLDAARAEHAALRIDAALRSRRVRRRTESNRTDWSRAGDPHRQTAPRTGHAPLALASFERARDLASDDRERCVAWIGIASVHRLTSDLRVGAHGARCRGSAGRAPDSSAKRRRSTTCARALYFAMGDVDACRTERELALEFAQRKRRPRA